MRIALGIEYNGANFHGWQRQKDTLTVQGSLETALSCIADETIQVYCAGRTDAGVHATHQVIHFDTQAERKIVAWLQGANSYLPSTISVQWATPVDQTFHARFSALSRHYHYIIYNHPVRSSLCSPLTTWVNQTLNAKKMHLASQVLIGEHDFSSFRSAACQSRTANRYIFSINVVSKPPFIMIDIIANSFLHHMVRNIVGVLLEIGLDRQPVDWCSELLLIKNRNCASRTALANGLYLSGVKYGDNFNLPTCFKNPLFLLG